MGTTRTPRAKSLGRPSSGASARVPKRWSAGASPEPEPLRRPVATPRAWNSASSDSAGWMGQIVVNRSLDAGHDVVAFDLSAEATATAAEAGATAADSVADLCDRLDDSDEDGKRIWLMVPAGEPVDATLADLEPTSTPTTWSSTAGTRSFRSRSGAPRRRTPPTSTAARRAVPPAPRRASLMIGGPEWAYEALVPIFDAVATGPAGHDRMGESGSGHYVKMVHNGVEYALMQAYGEGSSCSPRGATTSIWSRSRARGTTVP